MDKNCGAQGMIMKRYILHSSLISLVLLFSYGITPAFSQDFASRSYAEFGAEYLKLPRHAGTASLANASAAWEENLLGLQYNPGLIGYNSQHHVNLSYTFLTLDRLHYSLEYVSPKYYGQNFGVSITSFGVKDIEERDDTGQLNGHFDDTEIAADFLAGGQLKGWFSYGIALRYIHQQLGEFNESGAKGFGMDIGVHYKPMEKIGIGASLQNLGSYLWWETGREDQVVPIFRLGVNGNIVDSVLKAEIDIVKPYSQPIESNIGVEGKILRVIAVRVGIVNALTYDADGAVYMDPEFFLGVGLSHKFFGFEYAAMKPGSELGMGHKFSLQVNFN